jgi:predicted nucleotidyltransferase
MVERTILEIVQNYLKIVRRAGIHVNRAILFGSHARGEANMNSDIDILVIAPEFDDPYDKRRVDLLWELRARSDSRIEPIPIGESQWREDDTSAIVEIARREGEEISLPVVA